MSDDILMGTPARSASIFGWNVVGAAAGGAAIAARVGRWFRGRLALAFSLAFNGGGVGGIVFTPLWVALIERLGFATAAALLGATTVLVLWPLAGRYLRPTPETIGV